MSHRNRKTDCNRKEDAHLGIVPAGTPSWITDDLIEQTLRVWQPYYSAQLTPEDAVTMILSVGRMYQVFSSGSPP